MNKYFKILIVEDEPDFANSIKDLINSINNSIEIFIVESRDEAKEILSSNESFFDLISLDLKLPAETGGFEKRPEHGLAVLGYCKEFCPGTPILILTGSRTDAMVSVFLQNSTNIDIWSDGIKRSTIDHLPKSDIDKLPEKITPIFNAVSSLSEVELYLPNNAALPIEHDRLLRIFIKGQKGIRSDIKVNNNGLSGAKVYFMNIYGHNGKCIYKCVAKCGYHEDIQIDSYNYDNMISRLAPEITPRKLKVLEHGGKNICGVFYGLADGYEASFFKAAYEKKMSQDALKYIQKMTYPWFDSGSEIRISIAELRRKLLPDDKALKLINDYNLTWAHEFENKKLQSSECCIHGDLHGENILVNVDNNKANLIDYGDISFGSSTIDTITLECSFLFHPNGLSSSDWPTMNQLKEWANLDNYVQNCPVENEIRFCRAWSDSLKKGNREIAASLYAYSLRQLKYPETNKDYALALLEVARNLFGNT